METGLKAEGKRLTSELLKEMDAMEIINGILIPALDVVGTNLKRGQSFYHSLFWRLTWQRNVSKK
ncbi:MAG: B12-binding domain-containing protein [Eubacterium ventriosum]